MHDQLPEVEKEGFLCISEEEWIDDMPEEYLLSEYLKKGETEHM